MNSLQRNLPRLVDVLAASAGRPVRPAAMVSSEEADALAARCDYNALPSHTFQCSLRFGYGAQRRAAAAYELLLACFPGVGTGSFAPMVFLVFWDSIPKRCKGVHCVDLGENFPTHIFLQNLALSQPITS